MEHKCKKTDLKTVEKCELNAEQIKKALECCTRGRNSNEDIPCLDCPYNECNVVGGTSERQITGTCQGWLMKDALALINSQDQRIGAQDMTISELRQRAEKAEHDARRYEQRIKELTKENEKLTINMNAYGLTAKRLGEENERLRVDNEILKMPRATIFEVADAFDRGRKKGKVDTVRQMHSEIKERCIKGGIYPAFVASTIDQIAEEIIGDGKQ